MLARFAIVLFILMAISTTSYADPAWVPKNCREPAAPAALSDNPEDPANDMNAQVMAYNRYAKAALGYMNCLIDESMHDSETGGVDVTPQAQSMINDTEKKIMALHAALETPPT